MGLLTNADKCIREDIFISGERAEEKGVDVKGVYLYGFLDC